MPNPDFSQWGEQQIIADFLSKLQYRDYQLVDVGAGDGVTLSNTRALVEDAYIALLIEADSEKYTALVKSLNTLKNDGVRSGVETANIKVAVSGEASLDAILDNTFLQTDFDFLSIDVDGIDYHIWASLHSYRPKLVMIEFNPTIPEGLEVIQPDDPNILIGSSLSSLVALAHAKDYKLAAVTVTNALFVRADLYPHLGIVDNSIAALWTNRCFVTHTFYGYDGNEYRAGYGGCPWSEEALALGSK